MFVKLLNVLALWHAVHPGVVQGMRIRSPDGDEESPAWKRLKAELSTKVARIPPMEERVRDTAKSPMLKRSWSGLLGQWYTVHESDMANVLRIAETELNAARYAQGCEPDVKLEASQQAFGQETATSNYRFIVEATVGTHHTALGMVTELDDRFDILRTYVEVLGKTDVCSLIPKRHLYPSSPSYNTSSFLEAKEEAEAMMPKPGGAFAQDFKTLMPEDKMPDRSYEIFIRHPPPPADGIPASYNALTDHRNSGKCFANSTSNYKVLDQGSCGSCFAMTATSVSGDRLCLNDVTAKMEYPSAQHYLSCFHAKGCDEGGQTLDVYKIMNSGLAHDRDVPYKVACWNKKQEGEVSVNDDFDEDCAYGELSTMPDQDKCNDYDALDKSYSFELYSIESSLAFDHPQYDIVGAIQAAILEGGPVDTSMRIFKDFRNFFKFFPDGVYVHDRIAKQGGRHAVVMLGWGENGGADFWKGGLPYWHCRNSWGTSWGNDGYFKILRGSNMLGIETRVNYPRMRKQPYPEGVHPNRHRDGDPKWTYRDTAAKAKSLTLKDEDIWTIQMSVRPGNLRERQFVYRLARGDEEKDADTSIFVPLSVTFDIQCQGWIGAPLFQDERNDNCLLKKLSLRIGGSQDWKTCDRSAGCAYRNSWWAKSLWKVRLEIDFDSEFNGAQSLEFRAEGSSTMALKGGANIGNFDKQFTINLQKQVPAVIEPYFKLPFMTMLQVQTDSPKSKANAKIQLTLSCSRPCQTKEINVLDYKGRKVYGWTWDDKPWVIDGTSLHNIRSDSVDKFIDHLRGQREMFLEWKAENKEDGSVKVKQIPYELHKVFGDVVSKCPSMPYKITFGERLGALKFQLPLQEAGIKKMSCAEFGAPPEYEGTCAFECDGERWKMVQDACSCHENQCVGSDFPLNLGKDGKAIFKMPFVALGTEIAPMSCIKAGAPEHLGGTCAFKCGSDGRWGVVQDKCSCEDETQCNGVPFTLNLGDEGDAVFTVPPTKLGAETAPLSCIKAGAPKHLDGTCTFKCGSDRRWGVVQEKCSCEDETKCASDIAFPLNLGDDGKASFMMPSTKLGAETAPMSCIKAGAPKHLDGTCTFKCGSDRKWDVVQEKCSCVDETKCRGPFTVSFGGRLGDLKFRLPISTAGQTVKVKCADAGARQAGAATCSFHCGTDFRYKLVDRECNCWDR